ncbi:MAG: stage III sporulation protein AE [Clostridia bacterium]|nr:stage III sporulation protein AE [Clostridia bacterium]
MRAPWKAKIIFSVLMFFFMLLMPVPAYGAQAATPEPIDQEVLEQKLNSTDIKTIQQGVDKALEKSDISDAYRFNSDELLQNALKGAPLDNMKGLPKTLLAILGKEIKANVALVLELFAVMLFGAIIRSLQPMQSGISNEAARLGVNGVMVILAAVSFGSLVKIVTTAIESMQNIAAIAMPALFALMASSGKIVSVTAMQPIMFLGVNAACQILKTVLLPIAVMSGLLFLINSISERFKLKSLAKLLKSCAVWATGVLTLIFSIIVTIQKLASTTVDAVALRTTKFAISTFVPVAGKYMSDAADTIIVCASAARNAAGILTLVGLGLIFVLPFIKVFVVMMTFKLTAAVAAPLGDDGILGGLEEAAGSLQVMLGIMGAALFVLVLLTGTMMSSTGLMQ